MASAVIIKRRNKISKHFAKLTLFVFVDHFQNYIKNSRRCDFFHSLVNNYFYSKAKRAKEEMHMKRQKHSERISLLFQMKNYFDFKKIFRREFLGVLKGYFLPGKSL